MSYHVRLADVREARDQVLPIWADNLPVRGELEAKLRWFYADGPHGVGHTFVIEPTHERAGLVGSAGIGVRMLHFRGRPLRAALFADLAIERSHRSGFAALALVRAVKQHVDDTFDLGYGFPNAKAQAVYRRGGYRQLGEVRRYVRVLRSGRYLERRWRRPRLARGVAAIADRMLAAVSRGRTWMVRRGFELTWHDTFDDRFDRLWEEARHIAPVVCERTAAFLNWRFAKQPGNHHRIAALTEQATGQLRAYAVVRHAEAVAELADLFGPGVPELDALLRYLMPALYDLGYGAVSFRFLGGRRIPDLLAHHRFARRPETRMVALSLGEGTANELELADPASWFLTDLDEDT